MTDRDFLILGGSHYQIPYINAARKLGYRTICFDMGYNPPAKSAADVFVQCNTSDKDRAVLLARNFEIAGVLAPATDIAVATKARIDQALDLSGPTVTAAEILTDKTGFRQYRDDAGAPGPAWMSIDAQSCPACLPLQPPFIVKPNRSSGGRGARRIESLMDFQSAWHSWDAPMRAAGALVETWLDGIELSLEGFLRDGKFWFALITSRQTACTPFVATAGHRWPAELKADVASDVIATVEQICRQLGIVDGPVDADLIFTTHPELLELSPRPGGNCLSQMVGAVFGIDYPELVVRAALGERPQGPEPQPRVGAGAIDILNSPEPSTLHYRENLIRLQVEKLGIEMLEIDYATGTRVPAFHSGRDRLGAIVTTGRDQQLAEDLIASVFSDLEWRLEGEDT